MLHYKYILPLCAIAFTLISCNDFLEVELDDEIITSEAIVNRETAEAAVIGLYDNLQSASLYGGDFVVLADLLSGNAIATGFQPFYEELANARVSAGNAYVENAWIALNNMINAANNILANIDDLENISDADRDRISGTAYFFRAMAFFDLLRQYGEHFDESSIYGIPVYQEVLDRSSALLIERANVGGTYQQIISDLELAEALLPESTAAIFASQSAAQALLARVSLYRKDYPGAIEYATKVIENPAFELNESYSSNFEEEGSDESIFELDFNQQDGQDLSNLLVLSAANEVSATESIYEAFQETDPRRAFFKRQFGIYRCTKYGEEPTDIEGNVPVFRLAELYLIRAEALVITEGIEMAVSDLNAVRTRSIPNFSYTASDFLSIEGFQNAILLERNLEFAFEGHRWFDLVRYGRATLLREVETYRRILPIPLREVQVSNGRIFQNEGY